MGTLIYAKLIMYSLQANNFLYNIQANERLKKVKEKWSTIKFHVLFSRFLLSNILDNECRKQKWCLPIFTRMRLVANALVCASAIARIKWRRLTLINEFFYLKKKCFVLKISKFLCFCKILKSVSAS